MMKFIQSLEFLSKRLEYNRFNLSYMYFYNDDHLDLYHRLRKVNKTS